MVRVAVAGGTGHVGRAIVEGLVESQEHEVFVFTRKVRCRDSDDLCPH
jgi:nucleoside-diphosphate-sugar epimerase